MRGGGGGGGGSGRSSTYLATPPPSLPPSWVAVGAIIITTRRPVCRRPSSDPSDWPLAALSVLLLHSRTDSLARRPAAVLLSCPALLHALRHGTNTAHQLPGQRDLPPSAAASRALKPVSCVSSPPT
ncbi:hypothetical protein GGTG_12346 [Gaeumannomyces tritici R3-111a-1]|uniref:Uncharacterized protein n=1 Tax=Gaeumannomyces tritici (strain R3-111a-1) TaxID=644352 RepID=J3PFS1_GAET3|nr:hypothetical protein GGTG_12346 [Gaeumannomyces tritici R3-111a-1]EJT70173.1 hypothetical protein GGTG_12346 [Gaeumannomyces tritici R3-111a-1]